jgi:hypothetical protein
MHSSRIEAAVVRGRFGKVSIWSVTLDESCKEMRRRIQFATGYDRRGIAGFQPGLRVKNPGNRSDRWEIAGIDLLVAAKRNLRTTCSGVF